MQKNNLLKSAGAWFVLGATLLAQSPEGRDLSGTYHCFGSNGDGGAYAGVVVIAKHHDTYRLLWRFQDAPAAIGLGIRDGNVLAVSYVGRVPGVVLYEVSGSGLVGRWTAAGADGVVATETLIPITDAGSSPQPPPGAPPAPDAPTGNAPGVGV
jgi:hypothetical protein